MSSKFLVSIRTAANLLNNLRTVRRETKSVCGATVPFELASYIRATSS